MIAGDHLQMTGACSGGPVLIGLNPGDEELAHQLLVDYGRNMVVMVGLTIYKGSPGRSPRCGRLTPSAALPSDSASRFSCSASQSAQVGTSLGPSS